MKSSTPPYAMHGNQDMKLLHRVVHDAAVYSYIFLDGIEVVAVEINLKKQTWLLFCLYRPTSQSQAFFFGEIEKTLALFSSRFENFVLLGALTGAQLGIFEGRGPIHENRHTKTFKDVTAFEYCFADA